MTLGPAVGLVASKLGKPFMPWQQHVADVILEVDPATGRLAYQEFGLTVPRQSGKSTFVLAKAVHRASATSFFGGRQQLVYTAQTRQKARVKWEEDFAAELEASKVFASRVTVLKGAGNEHIRFKDGSRFGIDANTEKAGHGPTLDEAYIDEAFAQSDNRLEQAFRPAMITRPNKQLGCISTAGWLNGSPYLEDKVAAGRAAVERDERRGVAYFEWSAPDDADPADEAEWWACMPALGFTIDVGAIRAEYESLAGASKLADFRRAYLNQWVLKDLGETSPISSAVWAGLEDGTSETVDPSWALDVSPDRDWACIAVAGRAGKTLTHVEVTANEDGYDHREGTGWVVPRLVDLRTRWGDFELVVAAGTAVESLVPDIEAAGIRVRRLSPAEVVAGCGFLYDQVYDKTLRHLGQPDLTRAVAAARKRNLADRAFTWTRRSQTDITPLYAVTLAAWAANNLDGGVILW